MQQHNVKKNMTSEKKVIWWKNSVLNTNETTDSANNINENKSDDESYENNVPPKESYDKKRKPAIT